MPMCYELLCNHALIYAHSAHEIELDFDGEHDETKKNGIQ